MGEYILAQFYFQKTKFFTLNSLIDAIILVWDYVGNNLVYFEIGDKDGKIQRKAI